MFLLCKHLILLVVHVGLCISMTYSPSNNVLFAYTCSRVLYYAILLFPNVHQVYIYNIVERTIPKMSYFLRAIFHYSIFIDNIERAFASVVSLVCIILLKDMMFLVKHAEQRLAKIDDILYEDGYCKRIVHLHNNVYHEDTLTRFHQHSFDTNRMYLDNLTVEASNVSLAVHNYRQIRKKKKSPREWKTKEDKLYYQAASNRHIFISNRYTFFILPFATCIWCLCLTGMPNQYPSIVNYALITIDLFTTPFGNMINDISIDIAYSSATILHLFFLT